MLPVGVTLPLRLRFCTVPRLGFEDWYTCMNICIFERRHCRLPFATLFLGGEMTCHDYLTFYSSLLPFGSDTYIKFLCSTFYCCLVTLVRTHCFTTYGLHSLYNPFMIYRKTTSVDKISIIFLVVKEKQHRFESSFYRVFIIVRGMTTS